MSTLNEVVIPRSRKLTATRVLGLLVFDGLLATFTP